MPSKKQQEPISIQMIKDTFEILKTINGKPQIALWELAKEIGVNKVPLYLYMANHPELFVIGDYIKTKEKRTRNDSLTESLTNEAYKVTTSEENKGLHVFEVFITAEENPKHPRYLDYMLRAYNQYIHINTWQHPEELDFYLIIGPDSRYANGDRYHKYSKWRNTKAKIEYLKQALNFPDAMFGGKNESIEIDGALRINKGDIKRITALGWTTNLEEGDEPE